jgi:hypothetical protein
MTIRRQILLYILPLFACFGVIGSAVAWRLQTEADKQVFDVMSASLVISFAEFITAADLDALARDVPLADTALGRAVPRLERWAIASRIFLLDAKSGYRLADTTRDAAPLPDPALLRDLKLEEIRHLPMRTAATGEPYFTITTLVPHSGAVLGVEIPATPYLEARKQIWRGIWQNLILVMIIGVAVTLFVAEFLSWQVRQLQKSAAQIGLAEFPLEQPDGMVQEVADLGNAFEVMHSVLGDTVDKTRRSLVESDYFRGDRTLATVLQKNLNPAQAWSGATVDAAWQILGTPPSAALAGAVLIDDTSGAAFVGIAGPAGELDVALRARAAHAFLADSLTRRPMAVVAQEAKELFGLTDLVVAHWREKSFTSWSADGEGFPTEPAAWAAGAKVALTCLDPAARERLALYLENFPDHAPARMLKDLPPFFESTDVGVIVVLCRSTSAAQTASPAAS